MTAESKANRARTEVPYRPPARKRGMAQEYPDVDIEAFAAYLALERGRSRHTVRNYVSDVEQFARFVDGIVTAIGVRPYRGPFKKLRVATASDVRRWVMALMSNMDPGVLPEKRAPRQFLESNRSVKRKLAAVREFGRHLRRSGVRKDDLALDVRGPDVEKLSPKPFTEEEVKQLFAVRIPDQQEWQDRRDQAMLELTYGAGLRISELVGIDISDLRLETRLVDVHGKGRKERTTPFTIGAADAIAAYLAVRPACETQALFISWKRRRLTTSAFEKIFQAYADKAGLIGAHPHRLRHTYGTGMFESGADGILIRDLMGHESTQTTDGYVKISLQRRRDAIQHHPRDKWD